jgi:hypothetical protein
MKKKKIKNYLFDQVRAYDPEIWVDPGGRVTFFW